ncbi:MAG: MFS transporter [Terracidiphilus sp.]|nr:MFS transporter [Terracidiphilus sp.]
MPPEITAPSAPAFDPDAGRMTHQRWIVCVLLFAATVIAYVDRGVIANLEKFLEGVIPGLTVKEYGYITASFQTAYALAMLVAGGITDKLGTRKAFIYAIALWSIAAMLPGLAFSVLTLAIAMFILGLGEAANFPACIRTVAEWFPKRERTLATGIFNSGANVGNMLAPVLVALLVSLVSWRGAFFIAGSLGLVWLVFWAIYYHRPEEHPRVSKAELAYILSDPGEKIDSVPWSHVFPVKETWGFAIAKFLTDPIWWFYLFWIPGYLQTTFGLSVAQSRTPVVIAYAISILGSVGGGIVYGMLVNRGVSPNLARKGVMLVCVLLIVPIFATPFVHNLWLVVALLGMATAGHQGWSANLFTVPSDVFPKVAVASVTGFGGMAGAVGGILLQMGAGLIIFYTHSYVTLFAIACLAYPTALLILHLISPRLEPARLK